MRIALIVNPFASSVDPRRRVVIQRALAEKHDLEVIETTRGGHAVRLAHGARRNGFDVVVSLGGDGTINEVVNGLLGTDTLVAPLPGGSTNVFARALGYPNDPVAATHVFLQSLEEGSSVHAGVGLANDRAFLFNLGVGFDAGVVGRVERRGALKRYAGHPLFVASTFATWLADINHQKPWFSVQASGREMVTAQLAIALNCHPYTFLGNRPLVVAPEASVRRPLSLVGMRSLRLADLTPIVTRVLTSDQGVPDEGNSFHWESVDKAKITGFRPFPYQLDGEFFSPVDSLTIEHRPEAVRVVAPPSGVRAQG